MYGLNDAKDEDMIERYIRDAKPAGMDDGVHVTIEYFSGFELFNTRPYHNYETWSAGFRVKGLGVTVEREGLVEAVQEWYRKVKK
jgi:hypothetical protein